jgi:hypothetical protein
LLRVIVLLATLATQLILTMGIVAIVRQCLSSDAHTQESYTGQLPDARFHACLTAKRQ